MADPEFQNSKRKDMGQTIAIVIINIVFLFREFAIILKHRSLRTYFVAELSLHITVLLSGISSLSTNCEIS